MQNLTKIDLYKISAGGVCELVIAQDGLLTFAKENDGLQSTTYSFSLLLADTDGDSQISPAELNAAYFYNTGELIDKLGSDCNLTNKEVLQGVSP